MQRTANPCTSVQFRYRPPNSFLPHILFRLSSAVEQSAVNRLVACSNQAAGAIKKTPSRRWCFFYGSGYLDERRPTGACLERIVDSNEPAKFESYGTRRPRLREYPIWQLLAVLLNGRSLFPFRRFPCKKMPDTISGKLRLYDFY